MKPKQYWEITKNAFKDWREDKAPRLGAALAYYTVFSIAPLLIVVIAVAGLVFGQEAVEGELVEQLRGVVGEQGALAIQTAIAAARKPTTNWIATVVSLLVLLLGATGFFGQLQDALNTVWEVKPK